MQKLNEQIKNNPLLFIIVCSFSLIGIIYIKYILQFLKEIIFIINPIALGFCIAFILNIPLKFIENKLLKNFRINFLLKRFISIIILFLIIIVLAIVFINIIVPNVSATLDIMKNDVPIYLNNLNKFISQVTKHSNFDLNSILKIPNNFTIETIFEFLKNIKAQNLLSSMIGMTTSFVNIVINFVISLIFAIYVLIYKETLKSYTKTISATYIKNKHHQKIKKIYLLVTDTFAKFFIGQFLDACILGMICYIIMSLTKIPYASIICLMITITALIPILGAFIGTLFGFVLIIFISPLNAILFLAEFLVIQQIDNHLIYPNVVGKSIGIEGIFVMIAIIIGGGIAGPLGMLIAVPTMSIIYHIICEDIQNRQKKNKVQVV